MPARQSLFVPKYRSKPKGRAVVTELNITPEEFRFLTCDENIQAWAHLPLLARCIMFHRQYPDRWIRLETLRVILKNAGFKKKMVVVRKAPKRKTLRLTEFEDRVIALDDFVKKILAEKGHLVFADEAIFTSKGF